MKEVLRCSISRFILICGEKRFLDLSQRETIHINKYDRLAEEVPSSAKRKTQVNTASQQTLFTTAATVIKTFM
jgi:hypothetical protein